MRLRCLSSQTCWKAVFLPTLPLRHSTMNNIEATELNATVNKQHACREKKRNTLLLMRKWMNVLWHDTKREEDPNARVVRDRGAAGRPAFPASNEKQLARDRVHCSRVGLRRFNCAVPFKLSEMQCSKFGAKLRGSWACEDQCDSDAATCSDSERSQTSLSHGHRHALIIAHEKSNWGCVRPSFPVIEKTEEHQSCWFSDNRVQIKTNDLEAHITNTWTGGL